MGIEFELKYRATEDALCQLRRELVGTEQEFQMETTYYDTPEGHFSARKWTLRRRMENERSICTLKTPGTGLDRREWEVECDDIAAALPMLCKLGSPEELFVLARCGLQPICGARFTRVAKTILFENATLEVAMDQGVLMGGGKEIPLLEAEVELKEGSREACLAFGQYLARTYGLVAEPLSKFRRALDLYKGE